MKKIIAIIIRLFMPNTVRKHEEAKRIHNAAVLQGLLNLEHAIRDMVNEDYNQVFTTKNAINCANRTGLTVYNSYKALKEADFRQIRERINDNEDEPDSLLTINPYSTLCALPCATNVPCKKPKS